MTLATVNDTRHVKGWRLHKRRALMLGQLRRPPKRLGTLFGEPLKSVVIHIHNAPGITWWA